MCFGSSALRHLALLSDLHLGRGGSADDGPSDGAALAMALGALATRVDRVLLAGDIVETQHGFVPFAWGLEARAMRRRHARLLQVMAGPSFVWLAGNHDGLLGRPAGVLHDLRVDVGGRRLVVLHGHQVDPLHRHAPRLEALGSWGAALVQRAGVPWAWRVANGMASRVNGMHAAPAHSAFTRRLLAWGRARGATWIAHGHDHAPLLLERDGVTLVRPGATTGGHLRYALLDLVSGQASLHHERLG